MTSLTCLKQGCPLFLVGHLSGIHILLFGGYVCHSLNRSKWWSCALKDCNGKTREFHASLVAFKGDWPWLRKAVALKTGFTSKRVCHLCPGDAPQRNIAGLYIFF